MNNETSLVRYLIGASKVKYSVLDEQFNKTNYRKGDVIYIMLDTHTVFSRLFQHKEIMAQYADSYGDLVQDIVIGFCNVIGHYRRYIATHLQRDNVIIASFNPKRPAYQKKYCYGFGEKLAHRYSKENIDYYLVNKALKEAWDFICTISRNLEDVYCINAPGVLDFTTDLYAGYQVHSTKHHQYPMVIWVSKNKFIAQSANDWGMVLCPDRDRSKLYTKDTIVNQWVFGKWATKMCPEFTPTLLPFIWTICGLDDVSMDPLPLYKGRTSRCATELNKLAKSHTITPEHLSFQTFLELAPEFISSSKDRMNAYAQMFLYQKDLAHRFNGISLNISEYALSVDQRETIRSHLVNLYDQNSLEEYNTILAEYDIDPNLLAIDSLNMSQAVIY